MTQQFTCLQDTWHTEYAAWNKKVFGCFLNSPVSRVDLMSTGNCSKPLVPPQQMLFGRTQDLLVEFLSVGPVQWGATRDVGHRGHQAPASRYKVGIQDQLPNGQEGSLNRIRDWICSQWSTQMAGVMITWSQVHHEMAVVLRILVVVPKLTLEMFANWLVHNDIYHMFIWELHHQHRD